MRKPIRPFFLLYWFFFSLEPLYMKNIILVYFCIPHFRFIYRFLNRLIIGIFLPPLFWQKPLFFEMVHVIRTGNCISTHCFYMKMLKYMRVVYLEYNFFFYFICRIIKSNYFIYEMIFIHGISFIAFTSFNICNYKIVGRHM